MRHPDIYLGRTGNKMFLFAYLYSQMREGLIPDTYLQDPKYFEKYSDEIKQIFGEGIGGYLSQVGVHIRRAGNPIKPEEPNYTNNPLHTNLSNTNYYEIAMALFPNDNFLVFSDDPEWCKEKFKNNPKVQVMDRGDDIEDFNILASCKDQIIANSSFSWWAAYLNPNPNKKIIAPRQWYTDGIERTVCPKSWIKI